MKYNVFGHTSIIIYLYESISSMYNYNGFLSLIMCTYNIVIIRIIIRIVLIHCVEPDSPYICIHKPSLLIQLQIILNLLQVEMIYLYIWPIFIYCNFVKV